MTDREEWPRVVTKVWDTAPRGVNAGARMLAPRMDLNIDSDQCGPGSDADCIHDYLVDNKDKYAQLFTAAIGSNALGIGPGGGSRIRYDFPTQNSDTWAIAQGDMTNPSLDAWKLNVAAQSNPQLTGTKVPQFVTPHISQPNPLYIKDSAAMVGMDGSLQNLDYYHPNPTYAYPAQRVAAQTVSVTQTTGQGCPTHVYDQRGDPDYLRAVPGEDRCSCLTSRMACAYNGTPWDQGQCNSNKQGTFIGFCEGSDGTVTMSGGASPLAQATYLNLDDNNALSCSSAPADQYSPAFATEEQCEGAKASIMSGDPECSSSSGGTYVFNGQDCVAAGAAGGGKLYPCKESCCTDNPSAPACGGKGGAGAGSRPLVLALVLALALGLGFGAVILFLRLKQRT